MIVEVDVAMFSQLKAKAAAAATAAVDVGKQAYDQAKDRVETAQAGKKMLDDGGPAMKEYLLAKKASITATTADAKVLTDVGATLEAYALASTRLQASAADGGDVASAFRGLSTIYDARARDIKTHFDKLRAAPEIPSVSPIESDAMTILSVQQTAASAKTVVTEKAATVGETYNSMRASDVLDSTKERVSTVQAGKRLADTSSDVIKRLLFAKKAAADAVAMDEKVFVKMAETAAFYDDAAEQMRTATPVDVPSAHDNSNNDMNFVHVASVYVGRAEMFRFSISSMPPAPEAPAISGEEADALLILTTRQGVQDVSRGVLTQTRGYISGSSGSAAPVADKPRTQQF